MKRNWLLISLLLFSLAFTGCLSVVGIPKRDIAISGSVLDEAGIGIDKVAIIIEPDGGVVFTKADGSWQSTAQKGATVKAQKTDYSFTGPLTVNKADKNMDFVGIELTSDYEISGKILISSSGDDDGKPLSAVGLTFEFLDNPENEDRFAITENGNWTMDGLVGKIEITPFKEGYSFSPATQTVDKTMQNVSFIALPN